MIAGASSIVNDDRWDRDDHVATLEYEVLDALSHCSRRFGERLRCTPEAGRGKCLERGLLLVVTLDLIHYSITTDTLVVWTIRC